MNSFPIPVSVALLMALVSPGAAAQELATGISVLVGHPEAGAASKRLDEAVVVQLGPSGPSQSPARTKQKIMSTFRLASLGPDEVKLQLLETGKPAEVEVPAGVPAVSVELLEKGDGIGLYVVRMREGNAAPKEVKLTVERGGWGVVGGSDGAEAPYFFILVGPLSAEDEAINARQSDLELPKLLEKNQPAYPEAARAARVQGTVVLRLLVATDGSVREVKVLESADAELDAAALAAVRRWRFEPARTKAGKPAEFWYTTTFRFLLN